MNLSHYQHWTQEEMDRLHRFVSYSQASEFAMEKLKRLPQPVVQVCGPLTTGGRGSFQANVQMMHQGICLLVTQGKVIFDQRPFEVPMFKVLQSRKNSGYDHSLLEEFYLPLFESGLIKEFHFLPGWQSSTGAKWEHKQACKLKIDIFYISELMLQEVKS